MIFDEKEYQNLTLAAWLHDIGKFYQRGNFKLDSSDEFNLTNFAPSKGEGRETRYTHQHAIFSAKFIRENAGKEFDMAETIAALHHAPERANSERYRYLAKIITLADWMSSGERRQRESEEDALDYKAEPMISIFSQLKLRENGARQNEGHPYFIPLSPLREDLNKLFPVRTKGEAFSEKDGALVYKDLWSQFIEEVRLLNRKDFFYQIPYVLEKFTLTIAASTIDKPDLSLFHHAKTTAAIASCLYQLQLEEETLDLIFDEIRKLPPRPYEEVQKSSVFLEALSLLKEEDFLLVGGDVSGIQDFIYSITSEKALKGLRGRSFYLQLLSEVIGKTILNEFHLPEANLLYSGGGNLFLLLPRNGATEEKLRLIRENIDEILLKAHRGKLAIVLEWSPLSYADFFINFSSVWGKVASRQEIIKKKKFASLFGSEKINTHWTKIMGPFDVGGEKPVCSICGEEAEKLEGEICSLCHSFEDLSDEIGRAEAICLNTRPAAPLPERAGGLKWPDVFLALGFDCHLLRKKPLPGEEEKQKYYPDYLKLNSTDFAGRFTGYKFIASKTTGPDGNPMTLKNMADKAQGIKKWAALRADVDRLGDVFKDGLGQDRTISRLAMLSSFISLYFGARINYLIESKDLSVDPKIGAALNYVYLAYSGGDDLFIIGPWSVLPPLSSRIYQDFNKFSCSKLTLSAGIYLAPHEKFPLYQAASEAGDAEEQAKKAGRNRICFLEKVIDWTKYEEVWEITSKLWKLLERKQENIEREEKKPASPVPRAILSVLSRAYREKELKEKSEIPMERIWRLYYIFKRTMLRLKEEDLKKELQWLLDKSIRGYEIYPELNMAVRWAEYLTREEKNK